MAGGRTDPAYVRMADSGELKARSDSLISLLADCRICPRDCGVDRLSGEMGFCLTGSLPRISGYGPHFGEESVLTGMKGSGTIFFTGCNLGCVFCQNYDISHQRSGREVQVEELAAIMLKLQQIGCHNINLVTPTHQVPQIMAAVEAAAAKGLRVPLVYNCGGYEKPQTLKLLDGIVDIYMPDFKYWDESVAVKLSKAPKYPLFAAEALREMHGQVGDLVVDERGIAARGLLVRHLVLPRGLAGTREVMRFIAKEVSPNTLVNVMGQYRPAFQANVHPELGRGITAREYREALRAARKEGVARLAD